MQATIEMKIRPFAGSEDETSCFGLGVKPCQNILLMRKTAKSNHGGFVAQ